MQKTSNGPLHDSRAGLGRYYLTRALAGILRRRLVARFDGIGDSRGKDLRAGLPQAALEFQDRIV
ncbi:MAG: hypothetical protein L0Y57_08995 [Beijerinckiaceae bacterium]|nr:hypothetical protein [Beijerinckiaceae bacterium]